MLPTQVRFRWQMGDSVESLCTYTYAWLHIASGKTGTDSYQAHTRADFLEHLNDWNRLGAGKWQYWEKT